MKEQILAVTGIILISAAGCGVKKKDTEPPNILFCISDDQSFPHASAYGCKWVKTPAFDRVAAQGLLFTQAYTPVSKSSPSRAAIITGRNPWQLEDAANHQYFFPEKFTTYAEVMIEHGYHVGYTGKGCAPVNPGTRKGMPRELTGPDYSERTITPPTKLMSRIDYASNFEAFLGARPENIPFCFWYGAHEPHREYEFMSGVNIGNKRLRDVDEVPAFWPDADTIRNDILDYALEIEYFDLHLERMLTTLEEKGLLENTIVIVTSDNGMPFPRMKGYASAVANRIPLAIMWPKGIKNPGRVISDFISFTDFAPTFLELAGIDPVKSGMQPMEGKSLIPLLKGKGKGRDFMIIGKERTDMSRPKDQGYPVRGIINHEYVYIKNYHPERWPVGNPEAGYRDSDASPAKTFILNDRRSKGESWFWNINFGKLPAEELYKLTDDPHCLKNLAEDPSYASVKDELLSTMTNELLKQEDPRILGNGYIFDEYPHQSERQRNFYEKFMNGDLINPNDGRVKDVDLLEE